MRRWSPLIYCLVAVVAWSISEAPRAADVTTRIFRTEHVWRGFRPGSWKLVRVTSETIDEQGEVASSSVSERRTTLSEVSQTLVKLKVEAAVEVAGKKLEAPAQEVQEAVAASAAEPVETNNQATLTIGEREYPCLLSQTESQADGRRTVARTWTSEQVVPSVLRQETIIYDLADDRVTEETTMEIVSLANRRTILGRLRTTAEMRVVHKDYRGTTVTQAWNCPEVPGGIVDQRSEEYDANNRLRRRVQVELVDFVVK